MFADLDESIRTLLVERGNLNSGEIDIAFELPSRDWAASISKPTINLYMYDLRENMQLRNPTAWNVRRGPDNTAIKSRPDIRLDLSYNITAFANSVGDEHRLLARLLVTLLQNPGLPDDVLQGLVVGQEIPTTVAQESQVFQTPADFWGSIDNDIRPSIDYRLTVNLDLTQEIEVGLVLTSQFNVAQINGRNGMVRDIEKMALSFGGKIHRSGDTEAGIPGTKVTLLERALDSITDDDGRYQFGNVPPGHYTLVIVAPGMGEHREGIEVPSGSYDVGL